MQNHTETETGHARGYEQRDVSVGFFGKVILGFTLLTLVGMAVSLCFLNTVDKRHRATDTIPPPLAGTLPKQPPEPRLQVNPGEELQQYKAIEEAPLSRYEWIDTKNGIVRIPIDRAIELLAERGLPVRAEPGATPAAPVPAKKGSRK